MREVPIACYRKLSDAGFQYLGSPQNPSVILNNFVHAYPVRESPDDYMKIYVQVADSVIQDTR